MFSWSRRIQKRRPDPLGKVKRLTEVEKLALPAGRESRGTNKLSASKMPHSNQSGTQDSTADCEKPLKKRMIVLASETFDK
jgi:hypothetical protein